MREAPPDRGLRGVLPPAPPPWLVKVFPFSLLVSKQINKICIAHNNDSEGLTESEAVVWGGAQKML